MGFFPGLGGGQDYCRGWARAVWLVVIMGSWPSSHDRDCGGPGGTVLARHLGRGVVVLGAGVPVNAVISVRVRIVLVALGVVGVDAVDGGVIPGQEVDGLDRQSEGVGAREAGIGGRAEIDPGDQAGLGLPAGQRGPAAQDGDGWAGCAGRVRCLGAGDLIGDVQGPTRHAVIRLVGKEDAVDGSAAPRCGVGSGLDVGDGGGGPVLGDGRDEGQREGQEGGGKKGQGEGQAEHGVSPWDWGAARRA